MTNQIIEKYEHTCMQIIEAFCKKQELDFEYWLANKVGGAGSFGDFIFKFSDIVHDLKSDQPKGFIIEWYSHDFEANQDLTHDKRNFINYENYCLGERHFLPKKEVGTLVQIPFCEKVNTSKVNLKMKDGCINYEN